LRIQGIKDALDSFLVRLRGFGYRIVDIKPMNFGRHYMIDVFVRKPYGHYMRFYLIYQRRWFEQFEKYFGIPDMACTINLSILRDCVRSNVDKIIIAHSNGEFYFTSPDAWLRLVEENGWSRKMRKTGETVAHLPIQYLRKE